MYFDISLYTVCTVVCCTHEIFNTIPSFSLSLIYFLLRSHRYYGALQISKSVSTQKETRTHISTNNNDDDDSNNDSYTKKKYCWCRLFIVIIILYAFFIHLERQKRCGTFRFSTKCCVCSTTDISYCITTAAKNNSSSLTHTTHTNMTKKNISFYSSRFGTCVERVFFLFRHFFLSSNKFPAFLCFILL